MIINWKKPRAGVLIIPKIVNGQVVKNIQLLPGNNEISDEEWEAVKPNCQDHINAGNLIEMAVKKIEKMEEIEGKDGKKTKKFVKKEEGKKIKEINAKQAKEIVLDTWDLKTLEKWLNEEGRDEIRAIIHNQIEEVNNPKTNKGKKND